MILNQDKADQKTFTFLPFVDDQMYVKSLLKDEIYDWVDQYLEKQITQDQLLKKLNEVAERYEKL